VLLIRSLHVAFEVVNRANTSGDSRVAVPVKPSPSRPQAPWRILRGMSLSSYGVLVGRAVDCRREGRSDSPHYQVRIDAAGTGHRIAVNVLSQQSPSELLYLADDDFRHPVTAAVGGLRAGWHDLPSRPGGAALDFIRGNLFRRSAMRPLPPDVSGPDNDLADFLDHYVKRAIADPAALVYAFGERWGPEPGRKDEIFGFKPGNGVHDIHMNQGNSERFRRDDGVWQDGGLLLRLDGRWVGIFLAFQSQAWHTDDTTGHAIAATPQPGPAAETSAIRILAAMVNPIGAPERESVLLLNASPSAVDLTGWRLADRMKETCTLPPGPLGAGQTLRVALDNGVALGNKGGSITLLDRRGLKVAGVAYTAEQVRDEGWTVTF
jgi:uncharacterized protein YukJ